MRLSLALNSAVVSSMQCFKDTLKAALKRFNVDVDNWETLAQEQDIWRSIIVDSAGTSESDRAKEAKK